MKEIIPLKKDIIFKTKVAEVTSINLEHDYKILDDMVEGTVYLSGSYKMTEASVIEEDFVYNIPFSIAISKRINKDTIKIEIDDFKYSTSKDVMKVDISLELTCDEERVEEKIKEEKEIDLEDNITNIDFDNYMDDYFKDESKDIQITEKDSDNTNIENNINNLTQNIINNENKYYTYKVYIVRQGDTIENICSKYNVQIEDLLEYNDINNISLGDKIIIPYINND